MLPILYKLCIEPTILIFHRHWTTNDQSFVVRPLSLISRNINKHVLWSKRKRMINWLEVQNYFLGKTSILSLISAEKFIYLL